MEIKTIDDLIGALEKEFHGHDPNYWGSPALLFSISKTKELKQNMEKKHVRCNKPFCSQCQF